MKITVVIFISFLINACCTKKYCIGFEQSNELYCKGFQANELDSIYVVRFVKNTNFTQKIDSIYIPATPTLININQYRILLHNNYSINCDYKISFASLTKIYYITNIVTEEQACNNCPIDANDKFQVLKYYTINNIITYNGLIEITK